MSVLEKLGGLLGGGLAGKITDAITNVRQGKIDLEKAEMMIRDAVAQRGHDIDVLLIQREKELALAQADINKIEASSDSLFKSGWRPAVGWVCVGGLAYQLIGQPLLAWLSLIYTWMPPPTLAMDTLLTLLFGILGLGAYRTYEKTLR